MPNAAVTCYTDPLCSWSWAFEGVRRRLAYEMGDGLAWRTVLGGLLPDWSRFSDPLSSVHRPAQMGVHWYEVRQVTGMPLNERIWSEDPPGSSYPACVAVKAAALQGDAAGEALMRRLREAVVLEGRNVARREVLEELFDELAAAAGSALDPGRFRRDLQGDEALEAFRNDLRDTRYRDIGRFPTFIVRGGEQALMLVGYRPYAVFREALAAAAPDLEPRRTAVDPLAYALHWGTITAAEVAEAVSRPEAEVARELERAAADGDLVRAGQIYKKPAGAATLATQQEGATA